MPNRHKIEFKAFGLECSDTLVKELRSWPELTDFDLASLRVWAYESHEQKLKNLDKAIRHLDRWQYIHKPQNGIGRLGYHPPDGWAANGSKAAAMNVCYGMNTIFLHLLFRSSAKVFSREQSE